MWQEIKSLCASFFATYPNRKRGFLGGVSLGIIIWIFGFFPTLFAFFCGVIGLYIGSHFDKDDNLIDDTLKSIDKNLPDRFRHWKI